MLKLWNSFHEGKLLQNNMEIKYSIQSYKTFLIFRASFWLPTLFVPPTCVILPKNYRIVVET